MAKRKAKRNVGRLKPRGGFKISREPVVHLSAHGPLSDTANSTGLPRILVGRFLFAIARDAHTIFATWHIDWRSVFEKAMPVDRRVHLRLIGQRGVERRVAIEPMTGMYYLTTPAPDDSYRVEIGYFQPADTWNSVATSDEVKMPPQRSGEIADIDLATIPFHLSFEQLANLFGAADGTPLARVVSEFQKRALSSRQPNELSPVDTQILRKLNLSLPQIASARREFEKGDRDKLARQTRTLIRIAATSPYRGFEGNSGG
jgi:Domain of unknown function (DUF4912)